MKKSTEARGRVFHVFQQRRRGRQDPALHQPVARAQRILHGESFSIPSTISRPRMPQCCQFVEDR